MYHDIKHKQNGLTISSLLIWSVVLVFVSIIGMKIIPAYIDHSTINKTFEAISNDPNLQAASPSEIRTSFIKRAQIDNITVISGKDIKISRGKGKRKGKANLSAAYFVKIPLVANISIYIDFEAKSN